jgi:hypothetical protein
VAILHKRRHGRAAAGRGRKRGLRGQAQAAGRFEQEGGIAGREPAGIGE